MADRSILAVENALARMLQSGVEDGAFPGAAAAVVHMQDNTARRFRAAVGALGQDHFAHIPVQPNTVFDLASLTKALVTTLVLRSALPLDDTVAGTTWTLRDLLQHRSGLASWAPLYSECPEIPGSPAAQRWVTLEAHRRLGTQAPGTSVYSDLGFIVLGDHLAQVLAAPLPALLDTHVLKPLSLQARIRFRPVTAYDESHVQGVAPTEFDPWRARMLCGEVHDENCAALGGVSAHAGLFADVDAVADFAEALLRSALGIGDFLAAQTLLPCTIACHAGTSYGTGFDTKVGGQKAFGTRWSDSTFGHLGFTGTSIAIDPEKQLAAVLLSNRVHPSRDNLGIRAFRPAFHDRVAELIERQAT